MDTVQEIEVAVSQLSPEQLASFRKWFDEFCEEVWDKQFESDVKSGKLDEVVLSRAGKQKLEEALIEMEQGQTEEFDSVDDLIKDLTE